MFTNEWPLELDELFTASNLFSEFSTVIVWQLSPRQTDYYKCVITTIRQWPFPWMRFSRRITGKRFILTIHHPLYVTGHPGCVLAFLLPDCLTVASNKGRSNYDTNNKHHLFTSTFPSAASKRRFFVARRNKWEKENQEKELFPKHSWGKKQQQPHLNTFSWKVNPKRHWQGHLECEIIQFWWTLTLLCYFVRREALYIHSLELLPNWKPFPHMALNIWEEKRCLFGWSFLLLDFCIYV